MKERAGVCRGGLLLGLTFGRTHGLSLLRSKDSITPCLRLCPSHQGAVLRPREQSMARRQRASLALPRSLSLFLLLQAVRVVLGLPAADKHSASQEGNSADGGVLGEVNLTLP